MAKSVAVAFVATISEAERPPVVILVNVAVLGYVPLLPDDDGTE